MSAYILRLISKDMEQENNDNLKHEIKEILLALLNESDIAIKTPTNVAVNTLNDSDIDIINDYF